MSGKRILLVEDDFGNRRVVRRLLEAFGYEVTEAENGEQAIQLLEQSPAMVEIVLSDINMPQVDGIEMAKRLRSQPQFAQLRLVAMTAHTHLSILTQIRDAGFDDVCPKPIDATRVINAVENTTKLTNIEDAAHILTPDVLSELSEA